MDIHGRFVSVLIELTNNYLWQSIDERQSGKSSSSWCTYFKRFQEDFEIDTIGK